ncbi:hypothetical protein CJ030_MR5G001873 [Morella rubra]|uniref:DUF629 domain-containing protein n=1 Tax=Morella rubra TaxID=262757 RepID=A0A6A1VJD0_9ROSI|nr:hypothetical protein CJ030_MR5G001873 [Morella rubra]
MAPKKRPSASIDHPPSDVSIRLECDRALVTLQRGNHIKALKLIKESISHHSSDNISNHGSAILHRSLGDIHFKTAALIGDSNTKRKHLNHAAEAARQALAFSKKSFDQESRIAFMTQELKKLIEKCNNVGDGNSEKQDIENAGNGFLIDTNEDIVTLHEKRKEVESRVMAARLLQEKKLATFGSCSLENTVKKRRKYAIPKRIPLDVNRVTQIKGYWKETMTGEMKRGLLRVGIEDLKAHFINNKLAKDFLKEAIDFAKEHKKWKFWVCCCCGDRSLDSVSNMRHLHSEHIGSLSTVLEANVPEIADDECVAMVKNGVWKPVDIAASVKIMENQSRFETCDADSDSAVDGIDDTQNCHSAGTEYDPQVFITREIDKFQRWPLCEDSKRTELLERIHEALESLLKKRCLAESHCNELITFTMDMMSNRIQVAQIDYYDLDATLLFICFLEASDLEIFLRFLEELANSCGLSCLSWKNALDDELKGSQEFTSKERIVFSSDFSHLFLDERLLREELIPTTYQDAIADDGTAVSSASEIRESDDLPDSDAFINWLLTAGPAIGEQLEAWASLREVGRTQAIELFKILQMEFNCLHNTLKTKRGNDLCSEVLENFKGGLHQENKKSEQISLHDPQISYECCLSKLQKDLEKNADPRIEAFESALINSKLKTVSKTLKGQSDCTCIEKRILMFQGQLGKEIYILDAKILAIKEVMRQTELKLGVVSTYDYRSIMVHLLKSFMQAQPEDIFDKDANEKSEAATEALLEELALDSQTDMDRGCGSVGKSKFKKKKKNRQKAKNIKLAVPPVFQETSGSEEHLPFYEDKAQQTHDESCQIPEIDIRVSTSDELGQPQEERLSLEERMLAEALECQKKFENEAQLKVDHAEENKKTGEAIEEDVKEISAPVVYSKNEEGNGSSEQQLLEQFVSSSSICFGSIRFMKMGYTKNSWKEWASNEHQEDADDDEDTEQNSHFDVPSTSHTDWQRSIETRLHGLQLEMQQLREELRKSFE